MTFSVSLPYWQATTTFPLAIPKQAHRMRVKVGAQDVRLAAGRPTLLSLREGAPKTSMSMLATDSDG